jgi:hypothetical protein
MADGELAKEDKHLRENAAWCGFVLGQLETARANFADAYNAPPWQWQPVKAGYSWRVGLLPFLEAEEPYRRLAAVSGNFTLPLTQPAEKLPAELKKAMEAAVPVMTLKHGGKAGTTVYRRVAVKGQPDKFVVVESSPVPWAKGGDDLTLDPDGPLPKMGGNFPGGFFALCGDGKARFLRHDLGEKALLKALLTGEGVRPLSRDLDAITKEVGRLDFKDPPKR